MQTVRAIGSPTALLPPGPSLPRALQTYHWLRYPVRTFERCAARYGHTFTLRLLSLGPHAYVSDPAIVREIFTGDSRIFRAGDAYRPLTEPAGGSRSIFTLDEDAHLRVRRLLLPPFHGERIKRWAPLIERLTEDEIRRWPVDEPFALRHSMERITFEVIMRIVFGVRDPGRSAELRRWLPRLYKITDVSPGLALAFVFPQLRRDIPLTPWARYEEVRRRVWGLLGEEVRERRAELERAGTAPGEDLLSTLLAARDDEGRELDDEQLCDQLVTMLLAGHETTAAALTWAFERLLRSPAVLARLLDEVDSGDGNEYLNAVIDETLRSRPVGAHVARKLAEDVELGRWTIPAQTVVAVAIHLVHHRPELYPEPQRFRPERFMEARPESYAWIPFGGGVRRCLGAGLAQLEMQVVIATILRQARLRAARPEAERLEQMGVTTVPARGGEVVHEGLRRRTRRSATVTA